jgi:hypothetical protein
VRREQLGPEGQQLWDSIVNGRGDLVVTAEGGLAGPFNAFVTAPPAEAAGCAPGRGRLTGLPPLTTSVSQNDWHAIANQVACYPIVAPPLGVGPLGSRGTDPALGTGRRRPRWSTSGTSMSR